MVAAVGNRIRVFSLEDGKELLKLSSSLVCMDDILSLLATASF